MTLREAKKQFEATFIRRTLTESQWNVAEASRRLGISRTALYQKMDEHNIGLADRPSSSQKTEEKP